MSDNKENVVTHTCAKSDSDVANSEKMKEMAERGVEIAIDVAEHIIDDVHKKKSTTDIFMSVLSRLCLCQNGED